MVRRRSLRVTAAIVLATGMTWVAAGAAGASAGPQPAIAVAGIPAAGLTVVVAPAPRYAVTVTNVGDAVATASGDEPSSIAIEGASAGAVVSGAGLQCVPGDDEIDCAFEPALAVAPGEAVVVNVDGVTPDATGGGAIFSVTADFNGAESSVDVSTSAETYDTATSADSASAQPGVEKRTALAVKLSPALRIQRRVRARTVTVSVAHAKGAAGRLTVTARQSSPRGRHGARRAVETLTVTRKRIAGRYRYRFTVRKGTYTVAATWAGTGRWADQTRTRTYRAK
jgi:hypothetical protein